MEKYWSNSKNRKAQSRRTKAQWKNDEYSKFMETVRSEYWENESSRRAQSRRAIQQFSNPKNVKKHSEIISRAWKNPDKRRTMLLSKPYLKVYTIYDPKQNFVARCLYKKLLKILPASTSCINEGRKEFKWGRNKGYIIECKLVKNCSAEYLEGVEL